MTYLLDTHTLLWAQLDSHKLSNAHQKILTDPSAKKLISTISIWEISIKFSIGKLSLSSRNPEEFLKGALQFGFELAEPSADNFASFHRLPVNTKHKDPFDRMLIWQAIQSNMSLLSYDKNLADYKIHGLSLG